MRPPVSLPLFGLIGALLSAAPATAAPPDPADVLFNEGVAAMEAKRFEEGCPKLEESYKQNPRPGTLYALADCEAGRGRIATAVTRYTEYLALYETLPPEKKAKQGTRKADSQAQKAALSPEVPELTLVLPPDAPEGMVIKRDGVEVAAASLGQAIPVDPGEHVVTVSVPGEDTRERRVTLGKGERKQVMLPVRSAPKAPLAVMTSPQPAPAIPPEAPPDRGPSGRRIGAYVAGGIGVAGLALGGVMGGLALAKKGEVDKNCNFPDDPRGCNDAGLAAVSSAKTFAMVNTVSLGVGVAGVVTAAVLFFTEPKRATGPARRFGSPVLTAGRDGATVGFEGAW